MSMKRILNFRLNDDDARRADELRRHGINLSDLVRQAIRDEYERRNPKQRTGEELVQAIREIHERIPLPPDLPRIGVDVTDRRAASEFIRQRMLAKHRRIQ